jgi:hypothetical protein
MCLLWGTNWVFISQKTAFFLHFVFFLGWETFLRNPCVTPSFHVTFLARDLDLIILAYRLKMFLSPLNLAFIALSLLVRPATFPKNFISAVSIFTAGQFVRLISPPSISWWSWKCEILDVSQPYSSPLPVTGINSFRFTFKWGNMLQVRKPLFRVLIRVLNFLICRNLAAQQSMPRCLLSL